MWHLRCTIPFLWINGCEIHHVSSFYRLWLRRTFPWSPRYTPIPGQCTDYQIPVLCLEERFMESSPLPHCNAQWQNPKIIPWKKMQAKSPVILRQASLTSIQCYCLRSGLNWRPQLKDNLYSTLKGPQRSQCSSPERDSLRGRRSKGEREGDTRSTKRVRYTITTGGGEYEVWDTKWVYDTWARGRAYVEPVFVTNESTRGTREEQMAARDIWSFSLRAFFAVPTVTLQIMKKKIEG